MKGGKEMKFFKITQSPFPAVPGAGSMIAGAQRTNT